MDHANHWAQQAHKHIRVLCKGIGPRGATSAGERRAAEYVRDELHRLGLRDVRLESFDGSVSTWLPWAVAFSMAAWGLLIGLLFELVGAIVAALLYLVATWIIYRELYPPIKGHSVRRWLWRGESQNTLGVLPPAGPPKRRVVLMSYLDSARCPFFWRQQERRRLISHTVWPLFLSLPVGAIAILSGAITANVAFYFIALILAFPQIAALLTSLYAERSPFSPGANNNASGVGSLLALAERLKKEPLAQTEVWILTTGCRETGRDGVRAFLETHGAALNEAIFIALEGVGTGERLVYLNGEGTLRRTSYPSKTLALAARAAAHCREKGLKVSAQRHRGNPTEMGLVVRRGFAGMTINTWPNDWPGVAGRRQTDDTLDSIEMKAQAGTHTFAWALLQKIDAGLEQA
jgi:hypothetical protein